MSVAFGASPRKPVDVPFGRNYVPTWAFDHIKYFNGGSEIQLHLDKYTGMFINLTYAGIIFSLEIIFIGTFFWYRHWIPVKGFLPFWALQYAH